MKFLIDAQLPKALASLLQEKGYDAIHTLEMPNRNATDDKEINELSIKEKRIVISKDSDFYDSYTANREPYRLLYLTTGNIRNKELLEIFNNNIKKIITEFTNSYVIEVNRTSIINVM